MGERGVIVTEMDDDARFLAEWPTDLGGYLLDAVMCVESTIEDNGDTSDLEVEEVAGAVADAFRRDLERWLLLKFSV